LSWPAASSRRRGPGRPMAAPRSTMAGIGSPTRGSLPAAAVCPADPARARSSDGRRGPARPAPGGVSPLASRAGCRCSWYTGTMTTWSRSARPGGRRCPPRPGRYGSYPAPGHPARTEITPICGRTQSRRGCAAWRDHHGARAGRVPGGLMSHRETSRNAFASFLSWRSQNRASRACGTLWWSLHDRTRVQDGYQLVTLCNEPAELQTRCRSAVGAATPAGELLHGPPVHHIGEGFTAHPHRVFARRVA
jgi:hypothetical protein